MRHRGRRHDRGSASASRRAGPADWIARLLFGVPVLTRTRLVAHPRRATRVEAVDDRARDGSARAHRLRRRHLHRPVRARGLAAAGQPPRPRSRHRRPRDRSVLPLLATRASLPPAICCAGRDRRHGAGAEGARRRGGYRRRPRAAPAAARRRVPVDRRRPAEATSIPQRSSCPAGSPAAAADASRVARPAHAAS